VPIVTKYEKNIILTYHQEPPRKMYLIGIPPFKHDSGACEIAPRVRPRCHRWLNYAPCINPNIIRLMIQSTMSVARRRVKAVVDKPPARAEKHK
jgi:hypothetical protein